MKLLSIVSFFTLAVAANACGCVDYGNVFIERVSELFFSDDVYYTIGIEYDTWYASASPTTDEECAQGFIDILIGFEKGSYTIQTAPSSGRDQIANWIYGCTPIVNGCVAKDSTYTNMCKQYVTECGFDTWEPVEVEGSTVGTTEAAPTPSFNDTMGAYAEFYYTLCDYQGIKKSSYVYEQIAVCYTQFANDGMTSEEIDGNCNQCTQLGLYYIMNPEYVTTEPEPPVTQFSVEQFYAVLGYVFSSAELRIQFATSFYNYIALCPSAPEYCQWQKVIKDVCMINEGGYTCESSGEIGGTEMVNACVELTYELIAEGNVEVISFLTIYMTKVLKMTAVTSTVTFTGTVSMYSFLFSCVSESAGFASWSVYIEFYARWEAFCGSSTDLDWEDCEAWVTEFFFLCCHWTMPEVSTTYLPETSELPTDVTEVTATGSEATCVISTPEEECAYILMYFKFIGQIYGNVEWRTKLNDKCREHKKEKPDSSNSDKAKAFCGATHDCARHISGSGSGSNETPFPPEDEDPTGGPPEGEDSWEYFVNFAIEVFLVGDFSLLTEGACTMARYGDLIPTSAPKSGEGSGGSGGSGSGEGPTVSPTCDEIKSPSGIFIFFELIAIECGFYETSWFSLWIIKFKAIFLSLDWDCGCWGDFSWNWSIDWIELILEFLKAMTCGCVPSPEPGPTPAPNGVWTIYRFFTWFCSDVEYRYKFECFMSWYFELKGYTQFEELSFSEAYECCSLFIDYMIICVDNPDTPTKPEPASGLYITYDTFIYTFQYYCNFKGSTKFVEMASEKAAKCDDKASGSSHESSEEDNCPDSYGADYCVFVCQYMAISMGCWEDAEFQSNYWSQFMIGVNVAKGQSSEDGCWTQLQMLIDFIIQIICDWDQA